MNLIMMVNKSMFFVRQGSFGVSKEIKSFSSIFNEFSLWLLYMRINRFNDDEFSLWILYMRINRFNDDEFLYGFFI